MIENHVIVSMYDGGIWIVKHNELDALVTAWEGIGLDEKKIYHCVSPGGGAVIVDLSEVNAIIEVTQDTMEWDRKRQRMLDGEDVL